MRLNILIFVPMGRSILRPYEARLHASAVTAMTQLTINFFCRPTQPPVADFKSATIIFLTSDI